MIGQADATAHYIRKIQQSDGAIPWFENGILDPWDHVEASMGLSVAGFYAEAESAYFWLARHQRADGGWLAAYRGDAIVDGTRAETNFVAYVATGVWHHYLITGNDAFLSDMWPTVAKAIEFVLGLQAPTGEIYWALDTRTGINKDALVTGCSSIYKSLECAIRMAGHLDQDVAHWQRARELLRTALVEREDRFDRTWESKARYSMDWFYPVMTGVITGEDASLRLQNRWSEFVEPGLGCRCVSDQPWVTIAESCELTMACLAAGQRDLALEVFNSLSGYQAEDGSWWTGYVYKDEVFWPDERPTWTSGSVLLAIDALTERTNAASLFVDHSS
jgi:hypothetical protein